MVQKLNEEKDNDGELMRMKFEAFKMEQNLERNQNKQNDPSTMFLSMKNLHPELPGLNINYKNGSGGISLNDLLKNPNGGNPI